MFGGRKTQPGSRRGGHHRALFDLRQRDAAQAPAPLLSRGTGASEEERMGRRAAAGQIKQTRSTRTQPHPHSHKGVQINGASWLTPPPRCPLPPSQSIGLGDVGPNRQGANLGGQTDSNSRGQGTGRMKWGENESGGGKGWVPGWN